MAKGGLFAVVGPPTEDDEDYSDDAMPAEDEEPMGEMGGPFDAYADTVLDAAASPEDRKEALRQAILTLIEERV